MNRYRICKNEDTNLLEQEVEHFMAKGYLPFGSLIFDGSVWSDLSAPGGGFTTTSDVNYLIQQTLSDMGFFDGGTASGFAGLDGGSSANNTSSAIINGGTA